MQEQHQIPMNLQQREQVRDCVRLPEQTQSPVPDIVSLSNKTSMDMGWPRQQQSRLQNEFKTMMQ